MSDSDVFARSSLGRDIGTWLERRSGQKILIWRDASSLWLPISMVSPRFPLPSLYIPLRRVVVIQREGKGNLGLTMEIGSQREPTSRQINIFWSGFLSSEVPMSLPSLERAKTSESLVLAWFTAWFNFFCESVHFPRIPGWTSKSCSHVMTL